MADLFSDNIKQNAVQNETSYKASDIEVLEGLEPVRRRPGMYIGGTDERALHHLVGEILDNSMDEAVAGFADRIEIELHKDGAITIKDNGRGIPVDEHPKYPGKSALEVIMTTLHSGGKFGGKVYQTSGGLHGVGISVVNALSEDMWVEVARDKKLYKQSFSKGLATSKLEELGTVSNRRGTTVWFRPDSEIFGVNAQFKPSWLYQMTRSKAYLFRGVEIRWHCSAEILGSDSKIPEEEKFRFPNGLLDFLNASLKERKMVTPDSFSGLAEFPDEAGRIEFAIAWPQSGEGFIHSYCNTVPTPQGGTHEQGLRAALARSLRNYGEMVSNKKASIITAEDVVGTSSILLSVFIREPQFQGQTKDRLSNPEVVRLVDQVIKDRFDHWLSADPASSQMLLNYIVDLAEERKKRRSDKEMARKTATRKLRLPGKLADCSRSSSEGTELFIVEGDSAGGSAKQGRRRDTQAILPLRGKILNVVSASKEKIRANQEIQDLVQALGGGMGSDFNLDKLRYEKIIIMTDADVDGAHIAALLITLFYTQMRALVENGNLYLAQPPLYRLTSGALSEYAMDDNQKDALMKTVFKGKKKVDISRFKGLGEMPAKQLKETTMNPDTRTLIRVSLQGAMTTLGITEDMDAAIDDDDKDAITQQPLPCEEIDNLVERLMGKNAEARYQFIQENAEFVENIDI